MTARNHRALTAKVWRSVVRARHGSRSNGSRSCGESRWANASRVEQTKPSGADRLTLSRIGRRTGRGTPEVGPDTDLSTTSERRNESTPSAERGLWRIRNVAVRLLGSQPSDAVPLTQNEHGQHGQKKTPDVRPFALLPRLGSVSTPRTTSDGKRLTPGAEGLPEANGNSLDTPNDRSRYVPKGARRTEHESGSVPASGDSTTLRLHAVRANGMRPDEPPASATPTYAPSPSATFSGYSTVSVDDVPIATSLSQRLSITWFRSCVVAGIPSGISSGLVSRATRPRVDGSSWSFATGVATVAAPLPDREGATSLRCRVAPSRTTQGEGR